MFENEIIYVLDPQGRIIDANRTALETFGYSREDLGNISIKDIVERRCLPATVKGIQRVVETGVELKETSEVLCKTKEEKKIWIEAKLYPILKNGKIIAIYGTAKDVTLKKRLEERLRESEEMFRVMAEKSLVGVYLIQDGKFQYVNPKMAELWGYEANELIGKSPLEFIHPDDRETVEKNIKLRIKGEIESVNYKLRVVRKDGEIRVNEVYGSRTIFRGKPAIIGTLIDKIRCYTAANKKWLSKLVEPLPPSDMVEFKNCGLYTLVIPIRHDDTVIGRLLLQSEVEFLNNEKDLLLTLAEDLAFAIKAAKTEEEKWIAFEQIERNIEHFAILVDEIRNPLAAISLIAELETHDKVREKILEQVKRIDELVSRLDKGWLESEKVSRYLRGIW